MIRVIETAAPLLWPTLILVIVTVLLSMRIQRLSVILMTTSALAVIGVAVYWISESAALPLREAAMPGHLLALLLATAMPLFGAAATSYILRRQGLSGLMPIVTSSVVGVLLIIPVPLIGLALICGFTGDCL